jgi:hypothetical protein
MTKKGNASGKKKRLVLFINYFYSEKGISRFSECRFTSYTEGSPQRKIMV